MERSGKQLQLVPEEQWMSPATRAVARARANAVSSYVGTTSIHW